MSYYQFSDAVQTGVYKGVRKGGVGVKLPP